MSVQSDISKAVGASEADGYVKIYCKADSLKCQLLPITQTCPVCGATFPTREQAEACRDQPYDRGGLAIGDIVVVPGAWHRSAVSPGNPWLAFEIPPDPTSGSHFDRAGFRVPYFVVTSFHGDASDPHRALVTLCHISDGGHLRAGWNPANGDGHCAMFRWGREQQGNNHCAMGSDWLDDIQGFLDDCEPSGLIKEQAAIMAEMRISTRSLL